MEDATALSKEKWLEIGKEIDRIEWLPLTLIATVICLDRCDERADDRTGAPSEAIVLAVVDEHGNRCQRPGTH